MKYLAVFDDDFLSNFRLDDVGLTLVLTDKYNTTRAVSLKPIIRPILTVTEDCEGINRTDSLYLTLGHIEALREYERDKMLVDILKDINKSIDELPKSYISKDELRRQFGLEGEKE